MEKRDASRDRFRPGQSTYCSRRAVETTTSLATVFVGLMPRTPVAPAINKWLEVTEATVNGRTPAPPKKPGMMIPLYINTNQRYGFNHGFKVVSDFAHPQYEI